MNAEKNHKELGLWRATALVAGNIIGTGIFILPASLAAFGTLGLLGWVVTSIGSICLALMFAKLSRKMPRIGGPYAYSRAAFGDFVGFQMAWSYWIGTLASNAAISTAFVSYLNYIYPELAAKPHLSFGIACVSVWVFTLLNMTSIRNSGIAQVVILVMKIVPLCVIGILGVFYIRLENYFPLNPGGFSLFHVVTSSAALTLFAFLGLESATVPAENVINPKKTIPQATVLGTVFSAVVYIWTTFVLMGILPSQTLSSSSAPFADAAKIVLGEWGGFAMAICAAFAAFGTLNGWILLQGQIPVAAARDGLFPEVLGKISSKGTPVVSLVISSLFMTGMLYMNYELPFVDQFTAIVTFTTFAVLLPYLYSTVAELIFLREEKSQMSPAAYLRSFIITIIGFAYTLVIVVGTGQQAVFMGIIFVFIGFPVYALIKRKPKTTLG